jgi:hypothetical protein
LFRLEKNQILKLSDLKIGQISKIVQIRKLVKFWKLFRFENCSNFENCSDSKTVQISKIAQKIKIKKFWNSKKISFKICSFFLKKNQIRKLVKFRKLFTFQNCFENCSDSKIIQISKIVRKIKFKNSEIWIKIRFEICSNFKNCSYSNFV